jgi:hypothetical protein
MIPSPLISIGSMARRAEKLIGDALARTPVESRHASPWQGLGAEPSDKRMPRGRIGCQPPWPLLLPCRGRSSRQGRGPLHAPTSAPPPAPRPRAKSRKRAASCRTAGEARHRYWPRSRCHRSHPGPKAAAFLARDCVGLEKRPPQGRRTRRRPAPFKCQFRHHPLRNLLLGTMSRTTLDESGSGCPGV